MGWFGRVIGGSIGDLVEDKIRGDTEGKHRDLCGRQRSRRQVYIAPR